MNGAAHKANATVYGCCCFTFHVKKCAYIAAFTSAFFIVSNFCTKIAGYSETAWDWELLFLIVDGVAVLSFIYGIRAEKAAFLQPFVALSLITISFLVLLAGYLGIAVCEPDSYAGQDLEMELHKRLAGTARHFSLEFRYIVSIVATIAFIGILCSIVLHCWFVYLTVQCARYFRESEFTNTLPQQQQRNVQEQQQQQQQRNVQEQQQQQHDDEQQQNNSKEQTQHILQHRAKPQQS